MSAADPRLVDAVWQHGRAMPEADPAHWRQDECGAWMRREQYAQAEAEFGWKLVKVTPGGPDSAETLRPFHRRNGYDVARGSAHCALTADRASLPAEKYLMPPRNRSA
jgi:hypothetical protein